MNENTEVSQTRRLGRLPGKSTRKALQFSEFFKFVEIPKAQSYWRKKAPLPLRSFGNLEYGCCTRAKQAVASMRMERMEQRKLIQITDEEVVRVYTEMSNRLYGGGDNGAYEDDALNEWRNPETTFKDTKGNPYTIDAYLAINAKNHLELKAALALAGAKGIAVCLNLPIAFARIEPPLAWDIPRGESLLDEWMPGSWGGHSMWANGYDAHGIWLDHTWEMPNQLLTWEAAAAYLDESYLVIDSANSWRKRAETRKEKTAISDVIAAVNFVSSLQIA